MKFWRSIFMVGLSLAATGTSVLNPSSVAAASAQQPFLPTHPLVFFPPHTLRFAKPFLVASMLQSIDLTASRQQQPASAPSTTTATPLQPQPPPNVPVASSDEPNPIIRVRVAVDSEQLTIASSTATTIVLPDNTASSVNLAPDQEYGVSVGQGGLMIGNRAFPNGIVLMPESDGLVWVNGHWYRGRVRLVWDEGVLNAINEVDLEQYLYGVVGAEMPSNWQPEALKAQSIAARSYALALMGQPPSGLSIFS